MKPMPRTTRRQRTTTPSHSGLDIRQLRAFVALVESKRITAAAEALSLAQSTVSEALTALERSIGAPLVLRQRGGHSLDLTEAGRALLPHARKILAAVSDAHVAMAATTSRARAKVDIVANESVSSYLLPDILQSLRRSWPRTRFSVSVATCAGVRDGVGSGAFDLGLLLSEPVGNNESARKAAAQVPYADRRVVLPAVPLVLFAKPSHPLVQGQSPVQVGHHALAGYPLFVSDAAGDFNDLVRRFFRRKGGGGPLIEASGSIEGVKKAVVADRRAIGLLPVYAIVEELQAATFGRVSVRPAPPRMRLDAIISKSRARHPSVEELLTAIVAVTSRAKK